MALTRVRFYRAHHRDQASVIPSSSEMKASKNLSAAKKPTVQAVQTVQVVEALSANASDPDVLAQEIVKDLKAAPEQCCEIAVDLDADAPKDRNDRQTRDGLPLSSRTRRFSVQLLCLLF